MSKTNTLCLFSILMLIIISVLSGPTASLAKEPHPALTPYPDSTMSRRDNLGFGAHTVIVGLNPDGKTDATFFDQLTVDGTIVRMSFENPKGRSHLEIFQNYKEALESADYKILFSCSDASCGPNYANSRWIRVTGMKYFAAQRSYLSASTTVDGQSLHISLVVSPLRHQITVVEGGEMERGLVNAQTITEGLLTDGRVVLDGLFFDTDKADLIPTSAEALTVIADYLKENSDLKVYIVGHTDSTGTLEYNMNLSRRRAQTVVDTLVDDYNINRTRLDAHGIGPLSPTRSNRAESGRDQNRRVEMVEQ